MKKSIPEAVQTATDPPQPPPPAETAQMTGARQQQRVMRAAVIIAIANVIQRLLGMGREIVKANLFGTSSLLSAYNFAVLVPMTIYQLIVGGEMVTSSLVPIFSEYAATHGTAEEVAERRAALWHLFSTVLSLAMVFLLGVVILVEIFTPQVAWLVGAHNFSDPELFAVTVRLMRLAMPAVLFLSLSSIITAVLYALQRFTLPAFTVATFNLAIIVMALLWPDDITSLVWGLLLGAILMVLLQLPALADARLTLNFDWRHPIMRRIIRLYTPIVGVLLVNQTVIWISYRLAISTGDQSINYMIYATTLYQLPLGLVVMGLSIATLPMLSQQAQEDLAAFKETLANGLRLVTIMILPAAVGLFALAVPIVALLFEHGQFVAEDTAVTSLVLRVYLIGMPFAAIDQMLVYAAYARQDTLRPALVGVASLIIYLIVALLLIEPWGLLSLMVADAVKHMVHTVLMWRVMAQHTGGLRGYRLAPVLWKSVVATAVTGVAASLAYQYLLPLLPWPSGLLRQLVLVMLPGLAGVVVYVTAVWVLDLREAKAIPYLLRRPQP